MGIEDGIGCHCLIGLETEFLGHFDSLVIDQLSTDGNGRLLWIKRVSVFHIKLIRTYKFDATEVIECECHIAICRLYISVGKSNPITELSWKLDSVANFVCKTVHLYISCILHAILRAGTLITGHLLTLRFNRHSFGLQFQKPLPILCIHTNVWGITIIRVIKY